ncbi:hypothetical protein [Pseudarthrobacter sp. PS3-L1]|uniref:hypothetical protein n=1 Tax=Pseudarthrobacter sp. PS3-L1 TaxID=3046207 RepID=UPI0024B9E0CC|nr:hypothetical protein [Pseudarthrobacter sp. PS3-L1]MDJ0322142.1 hypothetical protein [Pseudarthrobacter sp. PS3-L1]
MSGNPYYVQIPKEIIDRKAKELAAAAGVSYASAVSSLLTLYMPPNATSFPRYNKGLNGQLLRWGKPLIHNGGKP